MNSFLVTYKLDNSTESYDDISSRLKNYPNWAKPFARTWIIRTSHSSKRVRDELADAIEGKGQIVVKYARDFLETEITNYQIIRIQLSQSRKMNKNLTQP